MARAALAGLPSPPVSEAGEQYAVAALIYFLVTGNYWQNFRLGREEMLKDLATLSPLSFKERGRPALVRTGSRIGTCLGEAPPKNGSRR